MLKTQIDNGFSCVIFQLKRLIGLCLFLSLKSSLCAEHVVRPSRMKQPFFFKDVSVFPKNKKRPTAASTRPNFPYSSFPLTAKVLLHHP